MRLPGKWVIGLGVSLAAHAGLVAFALGTRDDRAQETSGSAMTLGSIEMIAGSEEIATAASTVVADRVRTTALATPRTVTDASERSDITTAALSNTAAAATSVTSASPPATTASAAVTTSTVAVTIPATTASTEAASVAGAVTGATEITGGTPETAATGATEMVAAGKAEEIAVAEKASASTVEAVDRETAGMADRREAVIAASQRSESALAAGRTEAALSIESNATATASARTEGAPTRETEATARAGAEIRRSPTEATAAQRTATRVAAIDPAEEATLPPPGRDRPEPRRREPEKAREKSAAPGNAPTTSRRGSNAASEGQNNMASLGRMDGSGAALAANYRGQVQARIRREAVSQRDEAGRKSTVAFTVSASGAISGLRLATSSGSAAVDRASLEAVQRAAPFPPIPPELGQSSIAFLVPMQFPR